MGIVMEYEDLYEKYKKLLGEVNRLTEENSQLKAQLGLTKSETFEYFGAGPSQL
jgi:cell shape-determining protein MreC